uniref:Uncharacterized protein n=1 Tax=Romanomermis culicivorax TaxID=13658 RepID=A0A915L485_ROMCU
MVAIVVGKTVLFTHCWQCGEIKTDNGVDIWMGEEIGADDTLIISVIIEDYALDHMFTEQGLHCNDYWTMSVDMGAIGHFDFTTDWELEQLFVESTFD